MSDTLLEEKFIQALSLCINLSNYHAKPSNYPGKAIELLSEVAQKPEILALLISRYQLFVKMANQAIINYAGSVDNWQVESYPFGVKDHCNIINFLINLNGNYQEQTFFRGKDFTPEIICEFLKDWKGIDLSSYLSKPISIIN
jgi:hypothetical protein